MYITLRMGLLLALCGSWFSSVTAQINDTDMVSFYLDDSGMREAGLIKTDLVGFFQLRWSLAYEKRLDDYFTGEIGGHYVSGWTPSTYSWLNQTDNLDLLNGWGATIKANAYPLGGAYENLSLGWRYTYDKIQWRNIDPTNHHHIEFEGAWALYLSRFGYNTSNFLIGASFSLGYFTSDLPERTPITRVNRFSENVRTQGVTFRMGIQIGFLLAR